jgi:peptidoglycan/LPS O-acetylase OafA/YrhL
MPALAASAFLMSLFSSVISVRLAEHPLRRKSPDKASHAKRGN